MNLQNGPISAPQAPAANPYVSQIQASESMAHQADQHEQAYTGRSQAMSGNGSATQFIDQAARDTANNIRHRIKEIRVVPLDRGFIVTVGCQSMAISSVHELVSKFAAYVMNPEQTTSLYEKGQL
jgi:hypothetical protein